MLFPYNTDAPIYHWPIATVGLIVANVLAFIGAASGNLGTIDEWILVYGDGLHPVQWVSSISMHGDPLHLAGNMLFLWVFGLVVEGKLGWWKFLACYVGIGVAQTMGEQILMLGYQGEAPGSLGASGAIFGLMAIATVWAPLNEIRCYLIAYGAHEVDPPIWGFSALYTGLELVSLIWSGGEFGSSWLHLSGFLIGLIPGVVLLKLKLVDCEGWDVFHVMRDEHREKKEPAPAEISAKVEARQHRRDEGQRTSAQQQIQLYLEQGNFAAALKLREKMKDVAGGLALERSQLAALIKWLHGEKRWKDSAPLMAELIERFPEQADAVRIKLAQICIVELSRPGKALDLVDDVDESRLPEQQAALVKKITAKARQMQNEGVVEFDVDSW